MSRPIDASIIIPAYNEADAIGGVLHDLERTLSSHPGSVEVIVVDDGSSDGTAAIAQSQGVKLIQHKTNMGYGAALKSGIRHARHPVILITDADGTYDNKYIPTILAWMDRYDMVVGARTGEAVHIPLLRRPAKWILTILASLLTDGEIPDLNSGLRAFRRSIAEEFLYLLPPGFSFTTTITLAVLARHYSIKYLPIDYHRRIGTSKIRPLHDTLNFLSLICKTILYLRPLRIFLPASGLLVAASLGKIFFFDLGVHGRVAEASFVALLAGFQIGMMGFLAEMLRKH